MIYVVTCVRNEEYHLPKFLDHIRDYVDGFVVLDDGSTDKTVELFEKEPKLKKIIKSPVRDGIEYDERGNRQKVVRAAWEISEDKNNTWVLCLDPDERFELAFLKNIRKMCNKNKKVAYGFHFRELHNDIKHYRCDGIWDKKTKYILFPLSEEMDFDSVMPNQYHTVWGYKEILEKSVMTNYNLYHLKMIKKTERAKRVNLYNTIDPEKKIQAFGYDYLNDDEGMKLKKISFFKRYDYTLLPEDLKKVKDGK